VTSPSGEALETLSPRENRPQSRTIQAVVVDPQRANLRVRLSLDDETPNDQARFRA
jgi:hypothetical protein